MTFPSPARWPWPLRHLLFLLLFILAHAAGILVAGAFLFRDGDGGLFGGDGASSLLRASMFAALPGSLVTLLLWRDLERGTLKEIGLSGGARRWLGLGGAFALGLLLVAVIALPALIAAWPERIWFPEGVDGFARSAAVCFPGFLLVALSEELAFRGYLYRGLARHISRDAALGVSSCLFAALHLNNPNLTTLGALNIALAGLMLGGVARATGHLVVPIGIHAGWNFALGTLVGLPVSGVTSAGLVRIPIRGPSWWTGGGFGPEGSVAATLVLVLACVAARTVWVAREARGATADSAARAENPSHEDDDAGQQHE